MQALIQELYDRGHLGARWLVSQVAEDGTLPCDGDLGSYYKCVYPLRISGYPAEAAKVLHQIMALHYRPDGDLRNSDEEKASGQYTSQFSQIYPNGWIIQGAFLLGEYDVVRKLMAGVIDRYYDEELGTFRATALPRTEVFDVNSAAMAVELFLLLDVSRARRAADFLLRLLDNQPDPAHFFYGRVVKPFTYLTEPDPRSETYSAVKIGEENQAFWFMGLPAAALTQLYEMTGEDRYLAGAERFFDAYLRCGEPGFRSVTTGKGFWAASMLYRLTGRERYLEVVRKVGAYLISLQREDGLWMWPGKTEEEMGAKLKFDASPEYVRWFLEVAAELSVAAK